MRKRKESGQSLLLAIVGMSILLVGALGLSIDGAQLYAHRQMAQAAADAAAQAAMMSIFNGTNVSGNTGYFSTSASFNCTSTTTAETPCAYARLNGFAPPDTITVSFPTTISGVALASDFSPSAVHVLISRTIPTTLMKFLGATSSTVLAGATAAVMMTTSSIPIIVTHPNLASSFSLQGGGKSASDIKICGGPQQSIQVNSDNSAAVSVGGSEAVDLSKGGPDDKTGTCSGSGTWFGVFGGPSSSSLPAWMTPTGSATRYIQPRGVIPDPFARVVAPAQPPNATVYSQDCTYVQQVTVKGNSTPTCVITKFGTVLGSGICTDTNGCDLYTAGYYPAGIYVKLRTAIFYPGLYYMGGNGTATAKGISFGSGSQGNVMMCSPTAAVAPCSLYPSPNAADSGHFKGNGVLVYISSTAGGVVSVGSNGSVSLVGSDLSSGSPTSAYGKGFVFYVDQNAPANTGSGSSTAHQLGGGGSLNMIGTFYASNSNAQMIAGQYQTLSLQGNTKQSTLIQGEIVVSVLQLGGGGNIQMDLDPNTIRVVDQVGLVY